MDYGRGSNYMAEVYQLPALEGIQNTGREVLLSAIGNLSECNGADDPVGCDDVAMCGMKWIITNSPHRMMTPDDFL